MFHFILLLFLPNLSLGQDGPVVTITSGTLLGKIQNSRNGSDFYSFTGIPYAKPPIGELRLKPPVPIEPWSGTRNATKDGPICYQSGFPGVSEDCLIVNVYTRHLDAESKKPVLFYIHGGGFGRLGSARYIHGPDYLLDHDIVLVTVNYRLGTFGFFSTGDNFAPGNYGLKDQVLALRWVRDNIKFFGGNPDQVTISGESAGGGSVGLHLVSSMSRGLFHGAIMSSLSTANALLVDKDPWKRAKKLAGLLECPIDSSENMVECIRKIPAENISNVYDELWDWHSLGRAVFPVVEPENESERFLEKNPLDLLIEGNVAQVPTLLGVTKDEMIAKAFPVIQNEDWAADLAENWTSIAPQILYYEPNDTISRKFREFYLGSIDGAITNESFTGLGHLISDAAILFGVVRSAKLLSEKTTKPVYLYEFTYQGDYSLQYWPGTEKPVGVSHGDDMIYIFYMSILAPKFNTSSEDGQCATRITTLWRNFVETGNPTPETNEELGDIVWTPFTNRNPTFLNIGDKLTSVGGLYYEDRIALWESLFPINDKMYEQGENNKKS